MAENADIYVVYTKYEDYDEGISVFDSLERATDFLKEYREENKGNIDRDEDFLIILESGGYRQIHFCEIQ